MSTSSTPSTSSISNIQKLWPAIQAAAAGAGIEPALVGAIVMVESQGDPLAMRYEPTYRWLYKPEAVKPSGCSLGTEQACQKISWGLMQIMGAVARERGYRGWLSALCQPEIGLQWGCKHLAWLLTRYDIEDAVAAYNAGSPRRREDGAYVNQDYVSLVMAHRQILQGDADA